MFHDLRYLDDKESVLNMDFNLNKKEYQNSSIDELKKSQDKNIEISLLEKRVFFKDRIFSFDLDDFHRICLLEGLDNIALTLKHEAQIKAYEKNSKSFLV